MSVQQSEHKDRYYYSQSELNKAMKWGVTENALIKPGIMKNAQVVGKREVHLYFDAKNPLARREQVMFVKRKRLY